MITSVILANNIKNLQIKEDGKSLYSQIRGRMGENRNKQGGISGHGKINSKISQPERLGNREKESNQQEKKNESTVIPQVRFGSGFAG